MAAPITANSAPRHLLLLHELPADPAAPPTVLPAVLRDPARLACTQHLVSTLAALEAALCTQSWDIVLADFDSAAWTPAAVMQCVQALQPATPVIFLADAPTVDAVVAVMRSGARGIVDRGAEQRLVTLLQQELDARDQPSSAPRPDAAPAQLTQLQDILETVQDAVMSVALPERRLLFASASFERVLGYPAARFMAEPELFKQVVHPDDLAQAIAAQETCMREGFVEFDHRIILPDGQVRWLHRRAWIEFDAQGRPIRANDSAQDITERKQAEAALRQSEAYLHSLLDSQTAYIVRVDMAGKIAYSNARYTAQFDWVAQDLVGMSVLLLTHPDDHAAIFTAVEQCMVQIGTPVQVEIRKRLRDGGFLWTLWEFVAIPDESGAVSEVQCVGFDISKQKQSEEMLAQRVQERTLELEEERNLLRTVIDAVPDFIYVKDTNHRMLLNNVAHARSLGLEPPAGAVGKTDFELFPIDLAASFYADEVELFRTGQPVVNREERSIGQDLSEIWALTTKAPLRNLQGELVGMVGITRDVTEIKATEAALRASEEKFRQFIEVAPVAAVITDRHGLIVLVNQAAEELFGYVRDELIGQPIEVLVPATQRAGHVGQRAGFLTEPTRRRVKALELSAQRKDGSVFPVDIQLSYIDVTPEPLVMSLVLDISPRKTAEAALRQALVQEKELGELKSRFVSMATHEFRTPLATILTTTEALLNFRSRLDDAQIGARLDRIRQQVLHMKEIMEDVMHLSLIQAGRVDFNPVLGDLAELCAVIVEEFMAQPDFHDRLEYMGATGAVAACFDKRLMRQVITNLLANALKYSPQAAPVHFNLLHDPAQVTLTVRDHGIGIPAEDLKYLFQPFHRAGNVGAIAGTGLGLTIAKQAVELHGGIITVDSQVGLGTTMTVIIPVAPALAGAQD